jgi:hypothetical protein
MPGSAPEHAAAGMPGSAPEHAAAGMPGSAPEHAAAGIPGSAPGHTAVGFEPPARGACGTGGPPWWEDGAAARGGSRSPSPPLSAAAAAAAAEVAGLGDVLGARLADARRAPPGLPRVAGLMSLQIRAEGLTAALTRLAPLLSACGALLPRRSAARRAAFLAGALRPEWPASLPPLAWPDTAPVLGGLLAAPASFVWQIPLRPAPGPPAPSPSASVALAALDEVHRLWRLARAAAAARVGATVDSPLDPAAFGPGALRPLEAAILSALGALAAGDLVELQGLLTSEAAARSWVALGLVRAYVRLCRLDAVWPDAVLLF